MANTDKKIQHVDVGSVDKLARILGAFDENLNFLSRELGVLAYVDGVKIRIEGEEHAVLLAAQVLKELVKLTDDGEEIDKGRMAYCIELAKEGKSEEISPDSAQFCNSSGVSNTLQLPHQPAMPSTSG